MPWDTPPLRQVRELVRDHITSSLPGSDASVPNSVLRVMSDAQGALCHLTLQYIDWLALQLLPDTAEAEWLDRHGIIWLKNSDDTKGRKQATFAEGFATFTGTSGSIVPAFTRLSGGTAGIEYETTAAGTIGVSPVSIAVRALDPGQAGNLAAGEPLALTGTLAGVDQTAVIVSLTGGVDTERDEDLRMRVLQRIQNPAMGGSQANYVTWALAVPGVTRAWAWPEQGPGTITIRFLMDDEAHAADDGWPTPDDIDAVAEYIDEMRPVTVKDCYVLAPIKEFVDVTIVNLMPDTDAVKAEVENSLRAMLHEKAAPGQTIYAAWVSYAIMSAPGVQSFHLVTDDDHPMPAPGYMAVLGTLLFDEPSP